MQNYNLENGVSIKNAIQLQVGGATYYISKAPTGYMVFNDQGGWIIVEDIANVENQANCKVDNVNQTFTIGCVTVPLALLEAGKAAFATQAAALNTAISQRATARANAIASPKEVSNS